MNLHPVIQFILGLMISLGWLFLIFYWSDRINVTDSAGAEETREYFSFLVYAGILGVVTSLLYSVQGFYYAKKQSKK